jgi:predicted phage terminase large subunit-like protein
MPFVSWYLDQETGIPIPERSGVERYYASYCGSMVFGDSKEELLEKYPGVSPQTYVFISATIKDNPRMKVLNPGYVARLENLKRVERERLLLGSWFAKQESQGLFRRSWCEIVDCVPAKVVARHRGMDLASTLASESNPNPDWTASVRISKSDGYYYVEHVERYRELTHSVLEHIADTAKQDYQELGTNVPVTIPKDPGAAAAAANMFFVKTLVEKGVDVRSEGVSGHTGKLARMQPFLSLAEAGWVRVVKGDWNEMWFNELEDYIDGNRNQKDDMWDATASAAKAVMKNNVMPSFSMPVYTQPSPIPSL